MFMRWALGRKVWRWSWFPKKLRHSASWRCGFSHQMKYQLTNLVVQHQGCILGPFYFTRNGKTQGFYWDIDPCLWSWWDPVENLHQISGCRGVDDWEVWWGPNFGWVSFFPVTIEGFSVVSGESCGFFDEQNASKWCVSFLPLAWIIEIRNLSRVKRSLKIPQHLPLTCRHFEPLCFGPSPVSFRVCECQFFRLRKRHQTPEVTSCCCSRFQVGGDIGHFWDLSFSSRKPIKLSCRRQS